MRRKKSLRSTSFKFTEIGSPVYFGPEVACCGCVFCSAARFTAGSTGGAEDGLVEDAACGCRAPLEGGNRLPSGLSTNFEAASTARAGVSTGAALVLGA